MPVCLIQSLPGTVYFLTEALSVVVPDVAGEATDGVPAQAFPTVREGRAAWRSENDVEGEGDCFDRVSKLCGEWRGKGLFSFIEVQLRGAVGATEEEMLRRLAHCVDWLVIDGSSGIKLGTCDLAIERWRLLALQLREVTKKVGIRICIEEQIPLSIQARWIAQLALELGEPGFIFLDGTVVRQVVGLTRMVLDHVNSHQLRKGSAKCIPLIHSELCLCGDKVVEVLDLESLDRLTFEVSRDLCGGIGIQQGSGEALFGYSLWQAVVSMVANRQSTLSLFGPRFSLVQAVYGVARASGKEEMEAATASLERIWGQTVQEEVFDSEQRVGVASIVSELLERTKGQIGMSSNRPLIASLVASRGGLD